MVALRHPQGLSAKWAALAVLFLFSGCSRALVVHVPQPAGWSMGSTTYTATLSVSEAQALNIGGTTVTPQFSACTGNAIPGDIRVCLNGSRACEKVADKPAVKAAKSAGERVTVLYRCITLQPKSNTGLGDPLLPTG